MVKDDMLKNLSEIDSMTLVKNDMKLIQQDFSRVDDEEEQNEMIDDNPVVMESVDDLRSRQFYRKLRQSEELQHSQIAIVR